MACPRRLLEPMQLDVQALNSLGEVLLSDSKLMEEAKQAYEKLKAKQLERKKQAKQST